MDYKTMMIKQAKSQGRLSLHPYTIGVITSIVECNYAPVDKVNGISLALEGMNKAWNDKSLPRDYTDAKKVPLSEEAPKEISHPDCIVNVTKVQSLLEPWYVEQVLEERRVRK